MSRWLIAIDIGGTFTDAIAANADGGVHVAKVPSTPADPAKAFASALAQLGAAGVDVADAQFVFHGTTVATNAMLTGSLAHVVLVTTAGFRDILGYRDGTRPKVYDLTQPRPTTLVERDDRLEAAERLASDGQIITPLTDSEIARIVTEVGRRTPAAIAISFLFSYVDDRHEQMLASALRDAYPDVPVATSAAVAREFREYPRTATAAVNAGLRPVVAGYLERADTALRGAGATAPLMIMQSNGGCVPAARAADDAHKLLLSGPAAGVAGMMALGRRHGVARMVSFDMGGTSLDVCLVDGATAPVTTMQRVGDHPVICPSLDMITIGAGGGSIAAVDAAGRLTVGPASAGARPGPAAYGHGGTLPTVTDAHVVLGTLPTSVGLAGGLTLDRDAAEQAIAPIATALSMSIADAADGIVRVSSATMALAVRRVSVQRGLDPDGYTLVAFGGAGPLHAGLILRDVGFARVLIPRYPGLFAAAGLLATDVRTDESWTLLATETSADVGAMQNWLDQRAAAMTGRLTDDGVPDDQIRLAATADCRYLGQGFDLTVPISDALALDLGQLRASFESLHRERYGHSDPHGTLEIVTLRLSAFGGLGVDVDAAEPPPATGDALLGHSQVRMPGADAAAATPIYSREQLTAGTDIAGPAIIHQHDATTIVLDGQRLRVDPSGDMWLEEA